MRFALATLLLPSILSALFLVGCSDSTAPSSVSPTDGGASFDGAYDSGGTSFLLQRIEDPVPGRLPIYVDLIGSNVQIDETEETVSVDVAIRNAGRESLYAPATIWVNRFVPAGVSPLNADFVHRAQEPASRNVLGSYGFDYSDLLGEDGVLESGESSQTKTWILHDPGLESFSFAAEAEFGMEPDRPVIAGVLFTDVNRNGVRDAGEGPYFAGGVTVHFPDGNLVHAGPGKEGHYRVSVTEPGLYSVRFVSMLACVDCYCVTTPDPLEVLLTPGPNGEPHSFEHADIGIYPGSCTDPPPPNPLPPVVLTDLPPDEIEQDYYALIDAELDGETLRMRVGYSGCSPDHPFTLYAGRGFMESLPVQTWMLLAHDDRDEPCTLYFEETLSFDLGPIQEAHIEDYGEPGTVRIRFRDYVGQEIEFLLAPDLVTVVGVVTEIDDRVPVDGGAVIDLQLESGETVKLLFDSLFTEPPPPQWRLDLYRVIVGLDIGDHVRATGSRVPGGISLRQLLILDR